MNTNNVLLHAAAAGTVLFASPASGKEHGRKPNFLFILVDDLGIRDLACYGSTFYESPNIDLLASEGMKFTNAYASCPVCSPTRASIMTGQYPQRTGVTDWIKGMNAKNRKLKTKRTAMQLPLEEFTIAEALKKGGYNTYIVGKWHLGDDKFMPVHQGFDLSIASGHEKGSYYSPYNNPTLPDGPEGEYKTDRLTTEAMKLIEKNGSDKPFFIYLAFFNVHTPNTPCKRYEKKFQEKASLIPEKNKRVPVKEGDGLTKITQNSAMFASKVFAVDWNVGRIIKKLDELKIADNTIVIFTSDNGGLTTKQKPGVTSEYPYRAGKGWLYDGGIRVPLIIKWPGVTKPGTLCDVPVISMDFYPTLLDMARLPQRPQQHKDGADLVPLLKGEATDVPRKALYWNYAHYHGSTWRPGAAIQKGGWKLIEFFEDGRIELYNTKNDIREQNDLSKTNPEIAAQLLDDLQNWQQTVNANIPGPNPTYDIEKEAAKIGHAEISKKKGQGKKKAKTKNQKYQPDS